MCLWYMWYGWEYGVCYMCVCVVRVFYVGGSVVACDVSACVVCMLCVCCVYGVWYVCVVCLWGNVICGYEFVYVVCD